MLSKHLENTLENRNGEKCQFLKIIQDLIN